MRRKLIAICVGLLWPVVAWAQQTASQDDADLARIPITSQDTGSPSQATQSSGAPALRVDLDSALISADNRKGTMPGSDPTELEARSSLEMTYTRGGQSGFYGTVSGRFNALDQNVRGQAWSRANGLDLREAYLGWSSASLFYVELGRINVRNGTALGFNPTDFFKPRTQIDQSSADPSVMRDDRLGVGMLRIKKLWEKATVSLSIAPKIESPAALSTTVHRGLSPLFDQTNTANRVLLTMAYDIKGLSPQWMVFNDAGVTRYGFDISHPLGHSIVVYGEWAGGKQADLISRAIRFGQITGSLPSQLPLLPTDGSTRFSSDTAVGGSWAGDGHWTINAEYHLHQSGLTGNEFRRWQSLSLSDPQLYGELFTYIRGYASDQQEPLVAREYFLRVSYTDAFVRNLDLSAFTMVDAYDKSGYGQVSASYYLSNHWTVSLLTSQSWGGRNSDYGSLTSRNSVTFEVIRYF